MSHICKGPITIDGLVITEEQIKNAILGTNDYLNNVSKYFLEIELEIFHILGQRNISGFIGEIFARFLEKEVDVLKSNPHQDGRPDLLNLSSDESKIFFLNSFSDSNHNNPIKERFTPYFYGGLEVKCSIGDTTSKNRSSILLENYNVESFDVKIPRIDLFKGITYWGHHRDCSSLLGLYYDYYDKSDFNPQVISVFYSKLEVDDWSALSTGKEDSKKTSNTSTNASGREKIKNGLIAIINDKRYIEALGANGYCI